MPKQFFTKFFTIGHAARPLAAFMELLNEAEVRLVVDVRTAPRSRTNPQFDRETLTGSLATFGIEYRHSAGLGGLRPRQKQIPAGTNAFWQNQSFHNYADYAMSREFQSSLEGIGSCEAMRHHVRRDAMVALSPAHYLRLSARGRREGISHSRARPRRRGEYHAGCQARA